MIECGHMSERVKIFTDAAADLPRPDVLRDRYGVKPISVIPLEVTFGANSHTIGEDFGITEFRNLLKTTGEIPKTSALGPDAILKIYKELAGKDQDIISIHIGDNISGTGNNARLAGAQDGERINIFNSGTVSMAQGLLAIAAERAAEQGGTREQIANMLNDAKARTALRVITPNMEFLQASGRVSHISGLLAGLLKINPILQIDQGEVNNVAKPRTMGGALDWMIENTIGLGPLEQIAILDFDAKNDAANILHERLIKEVKVPGSIIYRGELGPITSSHGGPGTLAMVTLKAA